MFSCTGRISTAQEERHFWHMRSTKKKPKKKSQKTPKPTHLTNTVHSPSEVHQLILVVLVVVFSVVLHHVFYALKTGIFSLCHCVFQILSCSEVEHWLLRCYTGIYNEAKFLLPLCVYHCQVEEKEKMRLNYSCFFLKTVVLPFR